ncbi:hypothetical protein ELH42_21295 [Rhizobium ruizarguesonis]|uniref:Uncharacterized protein n=1 Tax=Rhizobium ruizarguesonis TaxID=2081791 RepID=A0AB38IC73_9HYPH|nr:hypothetical protein ELH85_26080 [Rhizobium ruizarguesonis]TAZ80816.1 hypothetical protein ELH68_24855 [Rhizobium ruizarguesonis]TBA07202.1 hypothetical protein ELH64_23380 [Rhizobium ruizarguesonis]TBA28590.1 hypothetical protein ELH61_23480 [Rhizobium ruizarguesonis]TBA45188.1 hypothetical protein ELH62_23685 [Rhizobium ruizarguesonis]
MCFFEKTIGAQHIDGDAVTQTLAERTTELFMNPRSCAGRQNDNSPFIVRASIKPKITIGMMGRRAARRRKQCFSGPGMYRVHGKHYLLQRSDGGQRAAIDVRR